MQHPSLDALAQQLSEQLHCSEQALCSQIITQVSRGKPVSPFALQTALQISQQELAQSLSRLKEAEQDHQGNIVGWGITLVPTPHRFHLDGKTLYAWCAFDTVLFPPQLGREVFLHSTCPMTGEAITFVAMPSGQIRDLTPASSVMSLVIPPSPRDCTREAFCQQSLFFASEQAASPFLAAHPDALLLSLEEAGYLGWVVASKRLSNTPLHGISEDEHECQPR